jgi:phospholipase C
MFENRSYDNVLGLLYNAANQPPYNTPPPGQQSLDGVTPGEFSNVYPLGASQQTYPIWGAAGDATTIPAIDPQEPFGDMAQQILGLLAAPQVNVNPYPDGAGPYGQMGGFVANYSTKAPPASSLGDVMHCFVPSLMPVTAYLANRFMVCDQWFGSVPTQTFANRLFAHCASPGYATGASISPINDLDYVIAWEAPVLNFGNSLFEQLDTVLGPNLDPAWKLYFHDYSITAKLTPYVGQFYKAATNKNLVNYSGEDFPSGYTNPIANPTTTFLEDIAGGTLPPYSFIEPRYSNNYPGAVQGLSPNSNHPGVGNYPGAPVPANNPPVNVLDGEALLLEVYMALRFSSYWPKTLLIVTYDEHGGMYDHVFPPGATSPGRPPAGCLPADSGFDFNVFGPRVPALIVSPYAPAGSSLQVAAGETPFDHTSIVRTAWHCFNLSYGSSGADAIDNRDAAAPSVLDFLDSTVSNNPADAPSGVTGLEKETIDS